MARFDRLTVYNTVLEDGMVPLFFHPDAQTASQIAGALAAGGSHLLEFTNRGDFAIEVFSALVKHAAQHLPDLIIGVGSVEDAPTAALFIAHGANFVVGPNFNPEIARLCNRRKIAYMPGCGSVTEIANAEEWGIEIIKVFPGKSVGGPDFIKNVLGPRPWSRLMPTGGVKAEEANLREWFDAGVVCVGMGSDLVRKAWIESGNYESITGLTRTTLEMIRTIRR
ncbi:MAG: bifunctional 4-hydroxy-2-oxoglutarate aldolase/2-dehydro-3-deoxy-phosphogluconate aldolase [Anaerolineaceae bacterium]|nr:bifunctional 4-hydroxy-2-oxoglutarate aldolase/2-dehydro-3-deoxy-phosphogluconate aldolase [Anaerolineaceae bacterium]